MYGVRHGRQLWSGHAAAVHHHRRSLLASQYCKPCKCKAGCSFSLTQPAPQPCGPTPTWLIWIAGHPCTRSPSRARPYLGSQKPSYGPCSGKRATSCPPSLAYPRSIHPRICRTRICQTGQAQGRTRRLAEVLPPARPPQPMGGPRPFQTLRQPHVSTRLLGHVKQDAE